MPLKLIPRPRLKNIPRIEADVIVTILGEQEGARDLIKVVKRCHGVESIWVPITNIGRRNMTEAEVADFRRVARDLARRLDEGQRVVIHCAAGVHRTGVMAYWTLREMGMDHAGAIAKIEELRPVTAAGCGPFLSLFDDDYAQAKSA